MKFCGECATPLKNVCPACGFENPPRFKFCGECGAALLGASPHPASSTHPIAYTPPRLRERILDEQAALEARAAVEGERKTITALFADIKGSMELMEDLDPEDARAIVDPSLQIMMDAVHHYDGYVAQSLGDGIFALFGAPIAQEDHAHRAIYAALRMQEEARRFAERLREERGVTIQFRIGINTGEVVVRSIRKDDLHTDYVPVGHTTGLAARAEALATPGSILVTEQTRKLTEGFFQFRPMGPVNVKGVSGTVQMSEVLGTGPLRTRLQVAARRGLSRFVGRSAEMAHLRRAHALAVDSKGQAVAVVGEAGMGKSRLFHEFKLSSPPGTVVLETFSSSHGKALPYLPIIEMLRGYFGLTPQDDDRQKREKVTGRVLTLDRSLEEILPYVFSLLGLAHDASVLREMDPQTRRTRTFDAVKSLLVRESLNQPIVVIFEDLHWLDSESEAFLSHFMESIPRAPILLLLNYRPEFRHDWENKTYYTQLRLDPLDHATIDELLSSLLGAGGGTPELRRMIVEKTEGNPFFIEEIVQSLFEHGILSGRPVAALTRPIDGIQIPPTVHGVLSARIDRLAPEEKALLQTLSVIGKQFSLTLLRKIVALPALELDRLLDRLQSSEFIFEQPAFPDPDFVFKHALTQEVAYKSLLAERRTVIHEALGRAIELLYADRIEEQYGVLAHHFSHSGNTRKAVFYLAQSGHRLLYQWAQSEAIDHLSRSLDLASTLSEGDLDPSFEMQIQLDLGSAYMATKGYAAAEVRTAYLRAQELSEKSGDRIQLARAMLGLAIHHMLRAEIPLALQLGEQLMSLATDEKRPELRISAHLVSGIANMYLLNLRQAREGLESALEMYNASRKKHVEFIPGQDPGVVALTFLGMVYWFQGFPDRGIQHIQRALGLAEELGQPLAIALALNYLAHAYRLRGETEKAEAAADSLMELARSHDYKFFEVSGLFLRSLQTTIQGDKARALEQIQQSTEAFETSGALLGRWGGISMQAYLYARLGEADKARDLMDLAEQEAQVTGKEARAPELYRMKGEVILLIDPDNLAAAEESFRRALDIARSLGAQSLELKAATDLARTLHRQHRTAEAITILSGVYSRFTEGFTTRDLVRARSLLDSLTADAPDTTGV